MVFVIPGPVYKGIFISRENRFIAMVKIDEEEIRCHLPNPGRMTELLLPNKTKVLIRYAPKNSNRKTIASLVGVIMGDEVINLDTNIVQKFLPHEFSKNNVPGLKDWSVLDQEKSIGKHRYDLILKSGNQEKYICEVKSTTRVVNKIACFPDAVSKRATSQISEMIKLQSSKNNTLLIFVIFRKAKSFKPCNNIDPTYSEVFIQAINNDVTYHILQASGKLKSIEGNKYIQLDLSHQLSLLNPDEW